MKQVFKILELKETFGGMGNSINIHEGYCFKETDGVEYDTKDLAIEALEKIKGEFIIQEIFIKD
jgi:hypothetical protein